MELFKDYKRIILIEEDELRKIIAEELERFLSHRDTTTTGSPRYVYGLKGLSELFNCSIVTANRIKASGKISDAISQCGRIIVTDTEKAMELFGQKKGRRGR